MGRKITLEKSVADLLLRACYDAMTLTTWYMSSMDALQWPVTKVEAWWAQYFPTAFYSVWVKGQLLHVHQTGYKTGQNNEVSPGIQLEKHKQHLSSSLDVSSIFKHMSARTTFQDRYYLLLRYSWFTMFY